SQQSGNRFRNSSASTSTGTTGLTSLLSNPTTLQNRLGLTLDSNARNLTLSDVTNGSFASRAGFESGDRILSINDERVRSIRDFANQLSQATGPVDVTVLRDGSRESVSIDPSTVARLLQGRRSPASDPSSR